MLLGVDTTSPAMTHVLMASDACAGITEIEAPSHLTVEGGIMAIWAGEDSNRASDALGTKS